DFASALTRAFVNAQAAAHVAGQTPPTGELFDCYDAVDRAGRELLLALGFDHEPATIVGLSRVEVAKLSGALRALVRNAPADIRKLLPGDVLDIFAPNQGAAVEKKRELAGDRLLIETARAVAFLVVVARAAKERLQRSRRRGPP